MLRRYENYKQHDPRWTLKSTLAKTPAHIND